ncbi:hypothetical protein SBADM41S_12359 [Streptomyces badius]
MRGSLSGAVSWIQKPREPLVRTPVTMPGTPVTAVPSSGETRVAPWMSWIRTSPGSVGPGSSGSWPPPDVSPFALTGVGAPAERSAALSSVSASEAARATDAVAEAPGTGAAAPPWWTTAEP